MAAQLPWLPLPQRPALAEQQHRVKGAQDLWRGGLQGADDSAPSGGSPGSQEAAHIQGHCAVQAIGDLIQGQHPGAAAQGLCQGHALLLPPAHALHLLAAQLDVSALCQAQGGNDVPHQLCAQGSAGGQAAGSSKVQRLAHSEQRLVHVHLGGQGSHLAHLRPAGGRGHAIPQHTPALWGGGGQAPSCQVQQSGLAPATVAQHQRGCASCKGGAHAGENGQRLLGHAGKGAAREELEGTLRHIGDATAPHWHRHCVGEALQHHAHRRAMVRDSL